MTPPNPHAAARAAGHVHGEAFMLMTYRADDGSETEVIWNSRDGVTPFVITLRSGKQATHANWGGDRYAPDHKPAVGDRIFVDLTEDRARQHAARNAQTWWDDNVAGAREAYATAQDLAAVLVPDYLEPGSPDLIEVAG